MAQWNGTAAASEKDPTESEMESWMDRDNKLRERLAQTPDQTIPEFRLLTNQGQSPTDPVQLL